MFQMLEEFGADCYAPTAGIQLFLHPRTEGFVQPTEVFALKSVSLKLPHNRPPPIS